MLKSSSLYVLLVGFVLTAGTPALQGQSAGEELGDAFPDLAALFSSFDVAHAAVFDRLVAIGESDDAGEALNQLRETLTMRANMSMEDMMQMGAMDMQTPADGFFGELETEALADLTEIVRAEHSMDEARDAYSNAGALPERAAEVIERGRAFYGRLVDIYADEAVSDKTAAVNEAIREYLGDASLSVPAQPKSAGLMYDYPYASSFKTGHPHLSGLVWASNWLRLAALEPLLSGEDTEDGVDTTIERFWNKLDGMDGMSMFPSEMPTTAAIAPLLQSRHQQAAVILDNLSMLETVVADLLVHPDVEDHEEAITAAVDEFTNDGTNLAPTRREYLLAALRAGIFNQGGPALGELQRSERNRSRMEMEMGPHVMPGMN